MNRVMDDGRNALPEAEASSPAAADELPALMLTAPDTPLVLTNPRLPDNPIVAANRAFSALCGYPAAEVLGRNCRFLQHEETDRAVVARLRQAIAAAEPIEVVLSNQRRDGSRFWNRLLVAPIVGTGGEVLYFFASQRDVTDEQRHLLTLEGQAAAAASPAAERTLSSERLQDSQRAAGAASWDWNPTTGAIDWSDGFEAVFGVPAAADARDSLEGWLGIVLPEDRAVARLGAARISLGAGRVEYRILRDGGIRWIECIGRVLDRDAQGRATRVTGISVDVTERKLAEVRARESESRFQAIAEATPIIFFVADAHGSNTYTSPQYSAFTGLPGGALAGQMWRDVMAPEDRARVDQAWRHSLATGGAYDVEARLRRHDGAWRWFLVRCVPMRELEPDGPILKWCGTATDIQEQVEARETLARGRGELERLIGERTAALTEALEALRFEASERARAEEALRQVHKMEAIGQLTGGIAHDFNNLLAAISGSLEMLNTRLEQGRLGEAAKYIEAARRSVDRGAGLTHRLLAFARQQALVPRAVQADRLVADLVELIRRTVGPAIEVATRLDAGAATVLCDANQLESALLNLAINARDAMAGGGTLTLSTRRRRLLAADVGAEEGARPGAYVEIAAADTGIGMRPEVRARAFDPFFTTKPLGQGTGLGLSQTYGFVRQSDGFVVLDSAPGEGTTVRLLLPLHDGDIGPAPAPETDGYDDLAARRGGAIVLVVEDEATLRELLTEVLTELGCRVLSAADGPAGLDIVRSAEPIDLMVTDVGLPGLDGRQLALAARDARPGLPILFITGYVDPAVDEFSLDPGSGGALPAGMEVIAKPFTLAALASRISGMLGAS